MAERSTYSGPALFSYGFRPFFLAATLFGLGVIPVWLMVWQGRIELGGPFAPVDWHIHEMIFGYAAAVIAGFLFTAVPNWTGRMPTRGWPLVVLVTLWVAGRVAVAGLLPIGPVGVAVADCAFLLAIAAMILIEIVAGRNWRNLKVVVPVSLLAAANLTYHLEAMTRGSADFGRRGSIAVVVFLITLIGGRIIPSFTRNWLAQRRAKRMPVPFNRFDGLCIGSGVLALAAWAAAPESLAAAGLLTVAGLLHLLRLGRWRGGATWRSPLLLMLHVAYLFVPLGMIAAACAAVGWVGPAVGVHLLGIGAIGGMTIAVMMRATRGHTGRALVAGPVLSAAFAIVGAAAIVRALLPDITMAGLDGVTIAATLWTTGYALLALRLVPWLARPSVARRQANRPA
ncbi:NnrS family protein [Frigidibacter sp. ROC022]|uniref:NnrS family protein n=1 Tax=Frigidibacter sp. ROC022 TaxID=2971796 RepID=UPI00215ABA41|nr:NnrS family protein [Frigidibacter sp. ROC022]MCR8726114.1 NnrS family protein [Frigidibacter sp. ROC022]